MKRTVAHSFVLGPARAYSPDIASLGAARPGSRYLLGASSLTARRRGAINILEVGLRSVSFALGVEERERERELEIVGGGLS